ncbi:MAG: YfiR family protein [Bacteroidia bacterium]
MKKLIAFLFFIALTAAQGVQPEMAVAHVKACYIYNFSRYIEWPENYRQGDFVIDVLGGSPTILSELAKMAASQTAGSQKFQINNIISVDKIGKCNILYIPSNKSVEIKKAVLKLKVSSTLIITDDPGSTKLGAAINFVVKDNRQKFELNRNNAQKSKLVVSSNLATLAILVE